MRTSIPISSGKAAISSDFSSAFTWPIAIFPRDEYALAMHGCLPSSPYALRRHLPSRWIVSPAGAAAHVPTHARKHASSLAEATDAESREDFIHKMKVALKELKESRVWLMFASRLPGSPGTARLLSESRELTLIFGKSVNTASRGRG